MKTIFIMYMPGHAGNFILRLFGLSNGIMPILERRKLKELVDTWGSLSPDYNKLENYKFTNIPIRYRDWQSFHRTFGDYLDHQQYRWVNASSNLECSYMYAIHPHEFDQHFEDIEYADFYYVELDPSFDSWVNAEQEKLKFVVRENEQEQFEQFKIEYNMKPISLTALLGDEQEFLEEYNRVCAVIGIDPIPEQALILRQDWRSMRFN